MVNDWPTFLAFINRLRALDVSAKEILQAWQEVKTHEQAIRAEMAKRFTKKQLLMLKIQVSGQFGAAHIRNEKKEVIINSVFKSLCESFYPNGAKRSFSMGEIRESFIVHIDRVIHEWSDELITQKGKEREQAKEDAQQARAAKEEQAKDPQTFEDFRAWYYVNGSNAILPDHLQKRFTFLKAGIKWKGEQEAPKVSSLDVDVRFSDILETTHTKKGHDLYVVQMLEYVDKGVYTALNNRAKALGGYYSSYRGNGAIVGFQFKTRENAASFLSLSDVTKARKPLSLDKLREKALKMIEKANDNLNADRKVNTAKRAREAGYAIEKAEGELKKANTMLRLIEGIENGSIKYLSKVRAFSELEQLLMLLTMAKMERATLAQKKAQGMRQQRNAAYSEIYNRTVIESDIEYVTVPFPSMYHKHVRDLAWCLKDENGFKQFAARLHKKLSTDGKIIFSSGYDLEQLRKVASISDDYTFARIKDQLKDFDRITRLGLEDINVLKAALYELFSLRGEGMTDEQKRAKEIKRLEAESLRKKIAGYFPTPKEIVNRMIDEAGIEKGNSICEPSAGKGNIADLMRERYPDNNLACFEIAPFLSDLLKKKGHDVLDSNFLENTGKTFDRIIMNPPFEKEQDIEHVKHAYSVLNEGGRIVAIMSAGPFFRSDKKSTEFREWLSDKGWNEKLPDGTFNNLETSTNVSAHLVIIDK